jgi:Tfp pilus assembly protein PilX
MRKLIAALVVLALIALLGLFAARRIPEHPQQSATSRDHPDND